MPTDPNFQELSRNNLLLQFTAHWLRKRESELMDWVTRVLGVVWTRDEVRQMGKGGSVSSDRVFLPLALGVNAELAEALQSMFGKGGTLVGGGDYKPAPGEEIVELGEMSPDEFKKWAAQATGMLAEKKDEAVTLGSEAAAADPKIEQMREQIAHSKRTR